MLNKDRVTPDGRTEVKGRKIGDLITTWYSPGLHEIVGFSSYQYKDHKPTDLVIFERRLSHNMTENREWVRNSMYVGNGKVVTLESLQEEIDKLERIKAYIRKRETDER